MTTLVWEEFNFSTFFFSKNVSRLKKRRNGNSWTGNQLEFGQKGNCFVNFFRKLFFSPNSCEIGQTNETKMCSFVLISISLLYSSSSLVSLFLILSLSLVSISFLLSLSLSLYLSISRSIYLSLSFVSLSFILSPTSSFPLSLLSSLFFFTWAS